MLLKYQTCAKNSIKGTVYLVGGLFNQSSIDNSLLHHYHY